MFTMKRLIAIVVIAVAIQVSGFASASERKAKEGEGRGKSAAIEWLSERHDFGAFDEDGGPVSCTFTMVNNSAQPVSIISARASCGCTSPSYPRRAIAPGDSAEIKVTYNPAGRPGRFDKNVKIKLSDNSAVAVLHIVGVVIGNPKSLSSRYPIDAAPLRLRTEMLPYGPLTGARAKSEFFEVYNASPDSVTPQWANVPDYINVASTTPTVPPGEQIAYALTLYPSKLKTYGLVTDSLQFIPAPGASPVTIEILANIKEDFSRLTPGQRMNAPVASLSTENIDLGAMNPGAEPAHASFTITNRGKSPLLIRRIYSLDSGVEIACKVTSIKKGKSARVDVTILPSAVTDDMVNARISVITNDPANPEQTIRITGYY